MSELAIFVLPLKRQLLKKNQYIVNILYCDEKFQFQKVIFKCNCLKMW